MSFRVPVDNYPITQSFGVNPDYYKQFGYLGHDGVDYAAPVGTPVYAADEGIVTFEGWGQNHSWMGTPAGICVLLNNGGIYSGYAHLSGTVVNKGQHVDKGQLIGTVGSTGAATGAHLHFEALPLSPNFKNGYAGRIDPVQYIELNGGDDMPIPNADNYYGRYRKAMQYIRGRDMSRDEFNANFVGHTDLNMLEAMLDNPEADAELDYANWGRTAKNDNWQQQIIDRTAERDAAVAELNKLKSQAGGIDQPTKDEITQTAQDTSWIKNLLSAVFNRK